MRTAPLCLLGAACAAPEIGSQPAEAWSLLEEVDTAHPLATAAYTVDLHVTDDGRGPDTLILPLPNGQVVSLDRVRKTRSRLGWTVGGQDREIEALLAGADGVISGVIRGPTTTWLLRQESDHDLLLELEMDTWPLEADPLRKASGRPDTGTRPMDPAATTIVDVLLVYTPLAVESAGGLAQLRAELALAMQETNEGLARSRAAVQHRVVGLEAVAVDEGDLSLETLVTSLRVRDDGIMDEVHALREARGADLVLLVAEHPALTACGQSYIMDRPDPSFQTHAFGSVVRVCATGNLSVAHELGHLLGAVHQRPAASAGSGVYPYSHGFVHENAFKTVMAIGEQPRVNRWSNPHRTFGSAATGVEDQADNARSVSESAQVTAEFRPVETVAPVLTFPASTDILGGTATFVWTPSLADRTVFTLGTTLGGQDVADLVAEGTSITVTALPTDGRTLYARLWTRFGTHWAHTDVAYATEDHTLASEAKPAVLVTPDPTGAYWSAGTDLSWTDTGADAYRVLVTDAADAVVLDVETGQTTVAAPGLVPDPAIVTLMTQTTHGWIGRTWVFEQP